MKRLTLFLLLIGFASSSIARTWRVSADGSGDAPDLYAAMDSAATGDSVLVGPGYFPLPERLLVPAGIRMIGEMGPTDTHLEALFSDIPTSGITLHGRLEGVHLYGVSNLSILSLYGEVDNCIVEIVEGGGGLPHTISVYGFGRVSKSLVANGEINIFSSARFDHSIIFAAINAPMPCGGCSFFSNDVFGDVHPNVTIRTEDLNFFLDPQFCGIPGSGNYFLKSISPCLPENNPYGYPVLVGPLGVGCGALTVRETTWGAIKAMYMDRR